jgi:hypothetical protein
MAREPLMPVDPILGTGLSPLAQWTVVPAVALFVLRRGRRVRDLT